MMSLRECKNWERINKSLMENQDGTMWRTVAHGLRQTISTKNGRCTIIPRLVRMQGRAAKETNNGNVNRMVYIKKTIRDNKGVIILQTYEPQKCDECKGIVVYNKHEEKQCSSCGLIHELILNIGVQTINDIYKNDDYNYNYSEELENNYTVGNNSKQSKEINARLRRIAKWESENI